MINYEWTCDKCGKKEKSRMNCISFRGKFLRVLNNDYCDDCFEEICKFCGITKEDFEQKKEDIFDPF